VGRLRRHRLAVFGAFLVAGLVLTSILAPALSPYNPGRPDMTALLRPPSERHWLGTDDLGRDVLARIMFAGRVSLLAGMGAMAIAALLGVSAGLVAGFLGAWTDQVLSLLIDAVYSFPTLILAVAIVGVFGPSLGNAVVAIGVVSVPRFARLIRGQVLALREREYVEAARAIGASSGRILVRHLLPNVTGLVVVQATLTVAFAILTEASLSFLGLGVRPPTPSWGSMLRFGYPFLETAPWLALSPGLAILLAVLGFNLLGDGIRDWLDPRLSG
jgi:peptide/nickel transport system permease protein